VFGRIVNNKKSEDTLLDMCKRLSFASKEKRQIPRFLIFSPCEVPTIGNAVVATLTSKVNELARMVDAFSAVSGQSAVNWPSRESPPKPVDPMPVTDVVVLRNSPKDLTSPSSRTNFLDSLHPAASSDIAELKNSANKWKVVVKSKATANSLDDKAKKFQHDSSASMKCILVLLKV